MSVQAIPQKLNFGSIKPQAIPAYTRKIRSIATNAQTFSESSVANIVLDTSTPGSFLDPVQSLIEFDLTITNTNPYVDYVNFSSCGAGSLIQELRIVNQGTNVEEILDYNTMFEMWMDLGGFAQEEFKLYMENPWRAPVAPGNKDLNFVKPPMIDREGIIMCPNNVNMFGDPNRVHTDQGQTITNGTGTFYPTTSIVSRSNTGINNYRQPGGTVGTTATAVGGLVPANFIHPYEISNASAANANTKSGFAENASGTAVDINNPISCAPGTIRSTCWTNRIDNTYVTWPSTIRPLNKAQIQTLIANDQGMKRYRIQDYLQYLSNVKNVPVGIAPIKSFIASDNALNDPKTSTTSNETTVGNWNFTTSSSHMTGTANVSFHICLPMFSGLLGVWAEKAFPTCLIAPGSLYIQIKWAKAFQAFQCAMDPCRRVFGTFRDYLISWGNPFGYATEYAGQMLLSDRVSMSGENYFTSGTPQSTLLAITTAGTNGWDYAYNNLAIASTGLTGAAGTNMLLDSYRQTGCNFMGFGEGTCTGCPKLQYSPIDKPWLYGGGWTGITVSTTYCEETQNVYGTYLPASTPQVRRCWVDGYNSKLSTTPANSTQSTGKPTYKISNLAYTGMQIVLPDAITASIVKLAAEGHMNLIAHSVRTYRALCSNSISQSIILPIRVASANSLFVLFQNQNMVENPYYLSCTRNCPFTSYTWYPYNSTNTTQYFVGSDVAPAVQSVNALSPFSIQLRIGNEYLPIQPIEDVPTLIQELQKAVHSVGDMTYSVPTMESIRHQRFTDNTGVTNIITGGNSTTEYQFMKNNDFLVPYIPVDALDDQTVTDNRHLRDLPASVTGSTTITPASFLQANNRGRYVYRDFLPPVSKFLLGFDLETFANQSDVARSGRYLGNGTITLNMSNAYACNNISVSTNSSNDSYNVLAVVLHDIRFAIGTGGELLAFY